MAKKIKLEFTEQLESFISLIENNWMYGCSEDASEDFTNFDVQTWERD
jgi:hypothetical protein